MSSDKMAVPLPLLKLKSLVMPLLNTLFSQMNSRYMREVLFNNLVIRLNIPLFKP